MLELECKRKLSIKNGDIYMKRLIALILVLMLMLTSCDTVIGELVDGGILDELFGDANVDVVPDEDVLTENEPEENEPEENEPEENEPEENEPEENEPEDDDPGENNPDENNPGENNPEAEHRYNANVILPTCEERGYTAHTCLDCGDTYFTDETDALGHNYEAYVNAPDCDSDGYTVYTCINCGDNYVADEIDALGHSYETVVTAPDCENGGYTTYTCTVCDYTYVTDETDALGHSYDAVVTEPTYDEGGYTTYTCTVCNYSYIDNVVGALKHSYKSCVVAPTCEAEGYTSYTCSDCGDTYVTDTVPAIGHSYDKGTLIAAPTCTESGIISYSCANDSAHNYTEAVPAYGHEYDSITTEPTCTTEGYTTYICLICGTYYEADRVDSFGHKYDGGVIITAPTCTSDGVKLYTCQNDGTHTYTTRISKTAHSYTSTVTAPTCTTAGYTTYTCLTCSYSYTSGNVAALGHTWKEATTEAPKTCIVCLITEGDKLPSTSITETLYVNYIDVGQGDSILIKVGDCDILIDAGVANMGSTVSSYLKKQGVDDIELMISTHPDADHCGGLTQVLKDFVVEAVWASPLTKTTAAYKNFDSAVKSEGLTKVTPSVGTVYTYESLTLTVLYNGSGTSDANDSSIVVMLEYGSYRFLFTGDISSTIESKLVSNKNIDLSCDVLKVAHHGSKYSSSSSFLKATGAKYGIICVGADNTYGHPTSTALNNLKSAGISVYRTDQDGSVVFSTDGASLTLPGNGGTVTRSIDSLASFNEYYLIIKRITVTDRIVSKVEY